MSKPSVLCYISEENGLPGSLQTIVKQHFNIVTMKDFHENQSKFSNEIIAVFNFHKKPEVTKELLEKLPNLKIVAVCSAGYNHINVKLIRSFGIKVSNAPGVLDDAVADFGMLLLLSAGRNLYQYVSFAKSPETEHFKANMVVDADVHGSTLGIIGMGRIGFKVAQRAKGFNMNILYHNRHQRCEADEKEVNATYFKSLSDILPLCDYVIVCVCLTPETTKMFKDEQFKLMKSSSIFSNISRGPVVDHDALVRALTTCEVKFAALDVTDPEPLPRDHPLLNMDNVILTPHSSSATATTRAKMAQKTVDNILAELQGQPLPSEVLE